MGPLRGTTHGADCAVCPYSIEGRPGRPVTAEYPENPAWILIGEGPTRTEVQVGRPLCSAGVQQTVDKALAKIGRKRDDLVLTTAVLCNSPIGLATDQDKERAVAACKPRLQAELAQWPGLPILTLGAVAARAVIPKATLDAIDPPNVPKTKKRNQKDRQKAEAKLLARAAKRRSTEIAKAAKKRLAEKIKYRRTQLYDEKMAPLASEPFRKRKKPSKKLIDDELEHEISRLKDKADAEAITEYELAVKISDMQEAHEAANPKPKKPPKHKPIKITDIMSTCFEVDVDGSGPRPVIPTIHPMVLLKGGGATIGGTHTPDLAFINLIYDASKVDSLARGKDIRLKINIETEIVDPERTWQLLLAVIDEAIKEGEVSIDLETYVDNPERHHALMTYEAKIRTIGLATTQRSVSVMWDLIPSWAFSHLQMLLAHLNVTKTFHNGLYDRTVLANKYNGFTLAGPWEDTMLAHHAAFPGCAHRLQVVTSQFFATPPWKCLQADVKVLLPDRSTLTIQECIKRRVPEVLSYENGQIVSKRVTGWHEVHAPGQQWVAIKTDRCDGKYTRGLIVTPDHKVMTQRGLVEATHLIVGEDCLAIDEPTFSEDQIAAALGTLLGDSSIFVSRVYHRRPWDARRASLRGGHANEGLRDCKVAALGLGTSCQMTPAHTRMSKGTVINAHDFYAYGTKWAYQYMELAKLVYDDAWRRRIKPEALARLGRRGLAMMYMDDGDLHRTKQTLGAGFATNGFPIEDVELFAQWLRERYGAVSIYRSNGPYCALSTVATRNMLEDLRGFIHPSVGYKTPNTDEYRPVLQGVGVQHVTVLSVTDAGRPRNRPNHRYCLSVADTKLFYTNYGLVSNSEFRNAEETPEGLTRYNALDTGATHALRPALTVMVKKTKTEKIYALDRKMAEIASKMHLVGMPVSREANTELLQTFSKNVAQSRRDVDAVAEDPKLRKQIWSYLALQQAVKARKKDPSEYHRPDGSIVKDLEARYYKRLEEIEYNTKWKWKIGSGKHIAALIQALSIPLLQTTATGQISTKKEILESLAHHPVVRDILTFRENDKLLSTFVWRIFDRYRDGELIQHGYADEDDRIHPIWSVNKITGRWASSEPVVSNVPKDKYRKLADGTKQIIRPNLRQQIVAPEGRVFVGFDFEQLEARIIALISGDPFLCSVFASGLDIHRECARIVFSDFDTMAKDDQKQARELTKPLEYGAFYGGAVETLWKNLVKEGKNLKLADVAKAVALLMNKMSGVVRWQRECVATALQPPHEIKDFLLNRRRTFPLGQVEATEAMNFGVQAAGAAIMNTGMARMDDVLPEYKEAHPITQIHDAAVFEVWEDDADMFAKDVDRNFHQEYERDGRSIPFPVGVRIAKTWAGL